MHPDFEPRHQALLMPRIYEAEDETEWSARILTVTDNFNCFVERYMDHKYIVRAYTYIGEGTQLRLLNRLQLEPLRGFPTVLKSNKGWLMRGKLEIELIKIPAIQHDRYPHSHDISPGFTCPALCNTYVQVSSGPLQRKHQHRQSIH